MNRSAKKHKRGRNRANPKQLKQYSTIGTNVIPSHYALSFEPDMHKFRFQGHAVIHVLIQKPTKIITLHSKELQIHHAGVLSGKTDYPAKVKLNEDKQELILQLPRPIKGKAEIHLSFEGVHNDGMYGFYRSKFLHNNKEEYLLTTQFEPGNARAAFPCFDEPAFKATFDVYLTAPEHLFTISNMPIKKESLVSKNGSSKKHVLFHTSPRMSTYLLYLAVGNFKFISTMHGKCEIRAITTQDKIVYAKMALDYTKTFLKYFEDYFHIKYPLPKLDVIAIPDFASGAMENWGAITFREIALLGDENTSVAVKQQIAITVAHELAHQWFGNLVTMEWWEDLWLNESFATFMSYKAVHASYPDWQLPLQYFVDTINNALGADQLESTHPISVVVKTPGEVNEIFDHISYDKGGSVLHMLENFVGEKVFRQGLSIFLKRYAYQNATKYDLWNSIQQAYAKTGIADMVHSWITLTGYPVVDVKLVKNGYSLTQRRFTLLEKKHTEQWLIPITYKNSYGKEKRVLMKNKELRLTEKVDGEKSWIKLNAGQNGFYRVHYPHEILTQLGDSIKSRQLSTIDAAGIENDLYCLMVAGHHKIRDYLAFVQTYCLDAEYPLNANISMHLNRLLGITYGKKAFPLVQQTSIIFHSKMLSKLGWMRNKNEKNTNTLLRSMTIAALGLSDHRETLLKANSLFQQIKEKVDSLDQNLRGVVYSLASWQGNKNTFDYLLSRYKKEQLPEESRKLLRALGMFKDLNLLHHALDLSISPVVRTQDSIMLHISVASNPACSSTLLWNWTKLHWKELLKKYNSGTHMMSNYVQDLSGADTLELRDEIKQFFDNPQNYRDDIGMAVRQVMERIEINHKFLE